MSLSPVTAMVVSYRTGPVLKDCLAALIRNDRIAAIMIVDNGNPAEMQVWLDAFAQDNAAVKVLRPGENLGFGRAVNLAARQAQPGHFLVVNPDAIVAPDALVHLQETGEALNAPWIVGGRIHDQQGREERGARRRDLTLLRALLSYIGINRWTLEHTPPPDGPAAMPVISGAFFLTSSDSFNQLGGFDEAYFLHVEDVDLCKRCRVADGQVFYDPRANALHHGATSDAPSRTVAAHKADSLALYFERHAGGPIERLAARLLMPLAKTMMMLAASRD